MPKKKAPTSATPKKDDHRVRIRMYRQGLGDCFLLSFPNDGKDVHMMIDCGVVLGTKNPADVMKQVAEDVKKETGGTGGKKGTLDLLVITHEHWDHLSGFDEKQARAVFDGIDIKTLWLAWTEDEGNALANSLREEREKRKAAAKAAARKAKPDRAARLAGLLGLFGAAAVGDGDGDGGETGGGTAGALKYLRGKCAPTILETGGKVYSVPGVEGVRVYVLGPPMDQAALKKTNPSKGEGYGLNGSDFGLADAFLAALDPSDPQRTELAQPFAPPLRKPAASLGPRRTTAQLAEDGTKPGIDWYSDPANAWRNIDDAWLATGERLALQLDNATNNTSLVLAFEFEASNEVLLFVGDAQAGNWRSWDDCKWTVKDKDGEKRDVTAEALLKNTIFYKVGHHGSHNATMQAKGLERMSQSRLAAVIPVDTTVAHEVKGWKEMPLPAIQKRLRDKCAVLFQSDAEPVEKKDAPKLRWKHSMDQFDDPMKAKTRKNLYTDLFL